MAASARASTSRGPRRRTDFAQDTARHGGDAGGLVEVLITFRKAKFVLTNDRRWQAEGYDACRAESTSASTNMEWCIRAASQLRVLRIWRVELEAGADDADAAESPASAEAPAAGRRRDELVMETSIAFGQGLEADAALRERCEDRLGFKREVLAWKEAEAAAGRVRRGSTAEILFRLSRMSSTLSAAHGCARLNVVGDVVHFGSKGKKTLAAAAQRVHDGRQRAEADKHGVTVTPASPLFGDDAVVGLGASMRRTVQLRNTSGRALTLADAKLVNRRFSGFAFSVPPGQLEALPLPLPLDAETTLDLDVDFNPAQEGFARDVLSLFFDRADGRRFTIARYLEARGGERAVLTDLAPTSEYKKRKPRRAPPPEQVTRTQPPPLPPTATLAPKLIHGRVDGAFRKRLLDGEVAEELETGASRLDAAAAAKASIGPYVEHMQKLLWAEEMQLHTDLKAYDMVGETETALRRSHVPDCLELKVDGLAEKRPSVLVGDLVDVNEPGRRRKVHRGRALVVELEKVHLAFDRSFLERYLPGTPVEVAFTYNRSTLRVLHTALVGMREWPRARALLFPDPPLLAAQRCPPRLPANAALTFSTAAPHLNAEQSRAVRAIVTGEGRCVPYVIFGPPGTGKTTTVVEAILQCVRARALQRHLRVLACAPTNTAADVLCERLARCGLSTSQLLRLNAYSRPRAEVPAEISGFCNLSTVDDKFTMPSVEALCRPLVLVATLITAGKLAALGVARGHFDVVFVDEAGQALEPEALAPAVGLVGDDGQLVVAGDPCQLGPVIHSGLAKEHGLARSYLERLMSREVYQKRGDGTYDPQVLTKLLRNFRAHEVLLELPNHLFYDGELLCCADEGVRTSCLGWEGLPTRGVPMLFHGIVGKDVREGNSPSWFNPDEVVVVVKHVQALLAPGALGRGGKQLGPGDIGVITPYNKQVGRIKKRLQDAKLVCQERRRGQSVHVGQVKVGSTEMFQGQERRVIIISTVRSSADFVGFDVRHKLGFLDSPKRFNVAITRACALLIVVGNPAVLMLDTHWKALLQLCIDRGAYRGVPVPLSGYADASESLVSNLEHLTLEESQGGSEEPSHRVQQEVHGMARPEE